MTIAQAIEVDFRYTNPRELQQLMDLIDLENQYHSKRYKADDQDNLVEVYTCPKPIVGGEPEQRLMGRFVMSKCWWEEYLDDDGITAILVETGFSMDDLLRELAILELRAFGVVKHGKVVTSSG